LAPVKKGPISSQETQKKNYPLLPSLSAQSKNTRVCQPKLNSVIINLNPSKLIKKNLKKKTMRQRIIVPFPSLIILMQQLISQPNPITALISPT
jgi:hypothetical protein